MTRIVVMGVAGSGKTTVGAALAGRIGVDFIDADDAHPQENIDKMRAGIPLSDADREPWLLALCDRLATSSGVVVTCSALKRGYRDLLRRAGDVTFVFLDVDEATAAARVAERSGHFMKVGMVRSQFGDLERPGPGEHDVVTVRVVGDEAPDAVVARVLSTVNHPS